MLIVHLFINCVISTNIENITQNTQIKQLDYIKLTNTRIC